MSARRRFNRGERVSLFLAAGGRCQICGRVLLRGWQADHIVPVSRGGLTVIENGRATCGDCNRKKGSTMPVELRRWQQQATARYFATGKRDFLLVATPGAGKTRVAADIARQLFVGGLVDRLIVVVPTIPLRVQWADALDAHGRRVDPGWKVGDLVPPDIDAIVVTYAAVASNPPVLRRLATEKRTLAIFDEIHHCGDDEHLRWGPAIREAFDAVPRRLSLSGTPFRSDNSAIPFVEYRDGDAVIDYSYGYRDALTDPDVCRMVFFPTVGGEMEWQFGETIERVRIEEAARPQERHALRTAIMSDGGWVAQVLDDAHGKLTDARRADPDAAGLVVCSDIGHAQRVAAVLRRRARLTEREVVVVTTDDEQAPARIRAFRDAQAPWIVAVRMVSEGVDIPRIRVVVWATAEKTELRFRQVVGRAVRVEEDEEDQVAWVFIPADRELLAWAAAIAEERTHALRDEEEIVGPPPPEQQRAFTPIDAEGQRGDTITLDGNLSEAELAQAETVKAMDPATAGVATETLAMFARNLSRSDQPRPEREPETQGPPHHDRRDALRKANNRAARAIAMTYGIPYDVVNARLNRSVRAAKLSGCSIEQLDRRLALGAHWRDTGDDDAIAP